MNAERKALQEIAAGNLDGESLSEFAERARSTARNVLMPFRDANEIDRDCRVIDNMMREGGGFARALALAARLADSDNLRRIKSAFSYLWDRYDR